MRRKNSKVAIVPLKGINTSTPDNTVEDGACEVLHNMRIKDGAWRNMEPLKFIDSLGTYNIGTYEEARRVVDVLYKHPSASEDSYVVVVEVSHSGEVAGREIVNIANREISHTFFAGEFQEVSVMHLGRLLILNIDGKMSYWRNTEDTGTYAMVSLPDPPTVIIPDKVMRSEPFDFVHTKNSRTAYTTELAEELVSYLAPCPIYAFNDGSGADDSKVLVYYPIFNGDVGAFVQPITLNDWWQGEICFFVAYKTVDGHYIRPSALNIIASEVDNSGVASDRTVRRVAEDSYSYGIMPSECFEQGLSDGYITIDTGGRMVGQGVTPSETWSWMTERIGRGTDYSLSKSLGIYSRHDGDSTVAKRVMANALMIAPKCRIGFVNTDPQLIDSIVIFATRIHPRWDSEKLMNQWKSNTDETYMRVETLDFTAAFADNKLPEQPFYKILEIPRAEWGDEGQGHYDLDVALTGSLLENAEQKDVWEPINPHEMVYKNGKEINSMMHIFGESSQRLFEGYGSNGFMHGVGLTCNSEWPIATSLKIDDVYYSVANRCGFDLLDSSLRKNIISYPDARAKQIWNGSATVQRNAYDLHSAIANNFAYYIADIFEGEYEQYFETISEQNIYYCKYPRRWKDTNNYINGERLPIVVAFTDGALYGGSSVKSLSELRVSALSNPLVFPLSRTYQIGSDDNKIIAINSAAIELSDEKIGEYPTWVFTTEGVFVGHWGEGDDVIYRAFLPRTYDRICNPNTLAVNGSVLFITQQGLMSIGDRGSQLISSALNNLWGKTPKWLVEAKMLGWKYDTNEVMVAGDDSDIYVFNLGAGLWSSRSKPITYISKLLANNVLVGGDSQTIYSIQQEGDFSSGGGYVRILTRSIKMGEYEMKRIEALIARLSASAKLPFRITIYGSIDGVKYGILRQATVAEQSSIRLTHVPMSVRYIKIGIEFPSSTEMVFTSFDIEYYNRFVNRLR